MYDLIEDNSILYPLLPSVSCLAEVYEENLTLHIYVSGKGKTLQIPWKGLRDPRAISVHSLETAISNLWSGKWEI